MAEPNTRQAKWNPKIKCEYSGCMATFGRNSDRRRHMKEKHGPLIYCCISGCRWTTRRMGRLRAHLDNVHHREANTDRTLLSEFRTAIAQTLSSFSNHFSTLYAHKNPNLAPTPPLIYNDCTLRSQAHQSQPDGFGGCGAFDSIETPQFEYNSTSGLSVALRTRVQAAPYRFRVFRPCRLRVRRRLPQNTGQISSTSLPPTHQDSAIESTLDFYSNEQDDITNSTHVGCFELDTNAFGSNNRGC